MTRSTTTVLAVLPGMRLVACRRKPITSASEAVDTVLSAFQRPALTTYDLALQNRALRSENERLRRDLEAYQHNYQRLREWADKVEPILERQRTKRD